MKKVFAIGLVCAVLGLIAAVYLLPSRREAVFYPMGGIPFRVIEYGRGARAFGEDMKSAEETVERLESVFSSYRKSSEVSLINREAHLRAVELGPDLINVISSAVEWWSRTGGAFDMTVAPLTGLWRGAAEERRLPGESEIARTLRAVGSDKIEIEDEDCRTAIRMKMKNSALDLGGIAKGYIVDRVAAALQERGVRKGVVEAGGDILAFGPGRFRFGIRDPMEADKLMGEIEIPAGALVTSGNYERFTEIGGKRYSHIIDPRSGRPADNGLVAVTVSGATCSDADALSTSLMVLGRERALSLLGEMSDFKGLLVEEGDGGYAVWVSRSLMPDTHFERPWAGRVAPF